MEEQKKVDALQTDVHAAAESILWQSAAWMEQINFSASDLQSSEMMAGSESAEKRRFYVRNEACKNTCRRLRNALQSMNVCLPLSNLPPLSDVRAVTDLLGDRALTMPRSWAVMLMEDVSVLCKVWR